MEWGVTRFRMAKKSATPKVQNGSKAPRRARTRGARVHEAASAAIHRLSRSGKETIARLTGRARHHPRDNQPHTSGPSADPEETPRRAPRTPLRVPVVVSWTEPGGEFRRDSGTTRNVNAFGALLVLNRRPPEKSEVNLTSVLNQISTTARIAWTGTTATEGVFIVGIELASPDPNFWPKPPH